MCFSQVLIMIYFISVLNSFFFSRESLDLAVESVDKATLRSTEGTVILHIIYAVKHDNDLVKEFIRFLKVKFYKFINCDTMFLK